MRHRPCSTLAALLALCALWGCGDSDGSPAKASAKEAAGSARAIAAFAQFPEASNLVIGIDVAAIQKSPLWQRLGPQMTARVPSLAKLSSACGFDPLTKVRAIVIGGDMTSDDNAILTIKGLSRKDLAACAGGTKAASGVLSELTIGDSVLWIAWTGKDELLMSPRVEMKAGAPAATLATGKKWLADRAKGTGGLDHNAAAMALLGAVDTGANVWFVALPNPKLPMSVDGNESRGAYGTVAVGDGLALAITLRMESAEVAAEVVDKANTVLAMLEQHPRYGDLVKALTVSIAATDSAVTLKASFSAESLDEVTNKAKNLAPAIFGDASKAAPE